MSIASRYMLVGAKVLQDMRMKFRSEVFYIIIILWLNSTLSSRVYLQSSGIISICSQVGGRSSNQFRDDMCSGCTVIQSFLSFQAGIIAKNQQLPKFLTMLGWHRSHTRSPTRFEPAPHPFVWAERTMLQPRFLGAGTYLYRV